MGYLDDLNQNLEQAMKAYAISEELRRNGIELKEICDQLKDMRAIGIERTIRNEDPTEEELARAKALNQRYVAGMKKHRDLVKQAAE